jgi:hypothetical protein
MDEKTEKNVVIWLLIAGFLGGIALYLAKFPPIIVSLFLALASATTIYHFIGGIAGENQVTWKWFKISGSAAVFIVVMLLLSKQLTIKPLPEIQTMFNPSIAEWVAISENGSPVKLEIKNIDVKGTQSIEPRKDLLKNNMLTLYQEGDRYHVVPEDNKTFILGNLGQSVFTNLGFFQYVQSAKGILYRTEPLKSGTREAPLRNIFTGQELTFKLTTGNYENSMSGYHLVDTNGNTIHDGELGVLQGEVVKVGNSYYLIFVLEANHTLPEGQSFARFAAYQIDVK